MAYSRKFIGVFGTLGYNHVADCKTDTADEILDRIKDGFARRDELAEEVAVAMENVNQRLDGYEALATDEMARALKITQK